MNEGRGQYASDKKTRQYVEMRDKTSLMKKNISIDKLLGLKYNVLVHIRTVSYSDAYIEFENSFFDYIHF